MFGTIPWNPLSANRPEKVAEADRVQREDRKGKSPGDRRKSPRKRPENQPAEDEAIPERPAESGKRIDLEA
jgi:hypothetical protein